jgi:dTDP-3-amino-2,3,6-trideoxy-4-keto-D-glucose/dTDP-3-amino-3,4,6-trideoxy-alpha-D-glucose/dTDP-2,6-dideoxy-D-kanosamine transaminase
MNATQMQVKYSYLSRQFAEIDQTLESIRGLVQSGDFTLGKPVAEFEARFAALQGAACGIGVGSGTDAIALSLKALDIGPGDEVITAANTFIATVGAIVQVGAKPVLVDVDETYEIDPTLVECAITNRTRALLPVHLCGRPADMPPIQEIAARHGLPVVEDAAQAINAAIDGTYVGNFGVTGCFSLHPLKNLNVWGDGGIIVTNSPEIERKLRLIRNHGMSHRDVIEVFGVNSRLDSLQALVGLSLVDQVQDITDTRIRNAAYYDAALRDLAEFVILPPRTPAVREVYHTYVIQVTQRDRLLAHLLEHGVSAKVHYPTPVHLQPAGRSLGYGPGDFPVTEAQSRAILTLPVHQHLDREERDYVVDCVRAFYRSL